ncbi:MAG: class I SAM-dependent methyltransferase [Clostridia bacterium]|nr:class I SAM-dependent methyltransferase [Clostridia bacterium]
MKRTEQIESFYESKNEDSRLTSTQSRKIEYLTTMKYIVDICEKNSTILDACAGTGKYSFALAELGYKVTAGDLTEHNVNVIRKKQAANNVLEKIYSGSILDLRMFNDNCFDIVLNLGSYYSIQNHDDRIKSITESLRVLRPNGYYFMAYLNKHANFIRTIDQFKGNYDRFKFYLDNGYDSKNNLFFSTTPENAEADLLKFNVELLHNIATDGPRFAIQQTVDTFNDEELKQYLSLHLSFCEKRSLLGYSEHGLIIAKK